MTFRALYFSPTLDAVGVIDEPRLEPTSERHKLSICRPSMRPVADPAAEIAKNDSSGVVIEMWLGWPSRSQMALASAALGRGLGVWLYWPNETAVERVDRERLQSYRRQWTLAMLYDHVAVPFQRFRAAFGSPLGWLKRWLRRHLSVERIIRRRNKRIVEALLDRAEPIPFAFDALPSADKKLPGTGVYLRTDYWAKIESGGSYGHTCYVVKELANVTQDFVCFMANRFSLIDSFGITQVEMPVPAPSASENAIVEATRHYFPILRERLKNMRPAYIYERLALGSYAGPLLSREFQIPYIVEYNGSEISMFRSFDGKRYLYEDVYLLTEELAFRQATFISVVSEEIRKTLVARGIPSEKILVNPNGADLTAYAPGPPAERDAIRRELQIPADSCVVGFSGTFGGWHGVDVLAAALPKICAADAGVRVLLIGDGNFKHLVDQAVAEHKLEDRVFSVGRVPQVQGARLLKACDIYVSPHSSHMVDSKFFGSPTKIFEYMAMAGGIVASDLEQIGVVLSPALRLADLRRGPGVTNERAVLCTPASVDEFVEAVNWLVKRPDVQKTLGRNARAAVADHYSWQQHVAHLWTFAEQQQRERGPIWGARWRPFASRRKKWSDLILNPNPVVVPEPIAKPLPDEEARPVATGDAYKDEVQRQWNRDPAGAHYVKSAAHHTLDWFLEAERYRYDEYAPWMRETMEFAQHAGEDVLEIGGGMGTDLAQFAAHGARVTDLDLSLGHLRLAKESLQARGFSGRFVHHDAETLCFVDNSFDVVYSNGVVHHTPNTGDVLREMWRVLRPGGKAIVMIYAENSLQYWREIVWEIGLKNNQLKEHSVGEIMSRSVECSSGEARPLVKVYTRSRIRHMFEAAGFTDIEIVQRQMLAPWVPRLLAWMPIERVGEMMGWNLVVKARKPSR